MSATGAPDLDATSPRTRRRVAWTATAAATAEWYDYLIFGIAAALVFGPQFFPSHSPVAGVLAAFAAFGAGFLARPVGGVIAGHYGDKYGRKPVLVASLAAMGIATVLIGLLPTYDQVGILAPIGLIALRLLQGAAVGAQWGGAMLLAIEYAPEGKRGLYGGLVQLGVPIGLIVANASFLLANAVSSEAGFDRWGWRLPFLFGAFVVALAVFIHRLVEDTPEFRQVQQRLAAETDQARRSPLRETLREHKGTVLLASGAFAVVSATFYIIVAGTLDYATRELHMPRSQVLVATLVVSICQFALLPAAAALSDRLGRLKVYSVGAAALALWAVPLFLLVDTGEFAAVVAGLLIACACLSLMFGPQAALFAELFSADLRYTGASLGYQIGSLLGGAVAPFVMVLLLETTGESLYVSAYIVALCVLALFSLRAIARRRDRAADPAAQPVTQPHAQPSVPVGR